MENNNEYAKEQFFSRIIALNAELSDPAGKNLISLGLREDNPVEFNRVKAIAAYAISYWIGRNENDARSINLLQRVFDSREPDDLKNVIEEFMDHTGYPAVDWPN